MIDRHFIIGLSDIQSIIKYGKAFQNNVHSIPHFVAVNLQNDITQSMLQISSAIRRDNTFHREFNEKLSHCFNSIFSITIEFNSIGLHSYCVIAFVEKFPHYEHGFIFYF